MNCFSKIELIGLVLSLVAGTTQAKQKGATLPAEEAVSTVKMEFDDVLLYQAVKWMSEKTKKNFIVDSQVRNTRINIFSGTPVTLEEAFFAFEQAIKAEGLKIVEEGKFLRITRDFDRPEPTSSFPRKCPPLEGITRHNDTTFQIKEDTFNTFLSDSLCFMRQVRIVPSVQNGQPNGFKIYGIRPKSLFNQLGFENGDVIQKINNFDMTSPDKALEMYAQVRKAKSVEVEFSRRGEAKKYSYKVE